MDSVADGVDIQMNQVDLMYSSISMRHADVLSVYPIDKS